MANIRQDGQRSPNYKLAIIGLSQSPDLLEELAQDGLEIRGVADFNLRHEVIEKAKARGIFVTQDYTEVLEWSDLDLILNLFPDKTIEAIIDQLKPDRALVIPASTAAFVRTFVRNTVVHRALTAILADVSRFLSGFLIRRPLLTRMLQSAMDFSEAAGGGLWVKKGEVFVPLKTMALSPVLETLVLPQGDGALIQRLLDERDIVVLQDLKAGSAIKERRAILTSHYRGIVMVPLIQDLEVCGALILLYPAAVREYPRELLEVLRIIGELLTQILEREGTIQGAKESLIRDELTGLYNYVYFLDRFRAELKRAQRSSTPCSLLYLHCRADRATDRDEQLTIGPYLRAISDILLSSVRGLDVPARYRKNDYAVILSGNSAARAYNIAERLLDRLSTVRLEGDGGPQVMFDIGIASFPEHGVNAQELIENAQLAAYLAAREGDSRIRVFSKGRMEIDGLDPKEIIRKYPLLTEVFQVLETQGARDHFTFQHARGVAHYASLIAGQLEFPQEEILEAGLAGWLHDVGKMSLPGVGQGLRERLSKLPELNLKIHSTIGVYILKNLITSRVILRAVNYHHAHFDGTGHPPGMSGESIPLEARIVAVANAYQHLQEEFGSSATADQQNIFQLLRRMAGNELDPQLVEHLIRGVAA